MHILHDILSTGLEIREEGYPVRNGLNIVDSELDADRVRDGDQVKHSVGRPSKDHGENLQGSAEAVSKGQSADQDQ